MDVLVAQHVSWMRARGLADTTVYQRRRVLARLQARLPCGLLEVTASLLADWQQTFACGHTAQTAATETAHIRSFYRWALRYGHMSSDVTQLLVAPRRPVMLPRPISEPNLGVALAAAPVRIRPWLFLAAKSGLRAAEIAALNRCDILDSRRPALLRVQGKGGRQRIVPLSPSVLAALHEHGLPCRGPVFPRHDGLPGPNRAWLISQAANTYLHSVGVNDTLHSLRHRFATRVQEEGRDLRVTQMLMGHASPVSTSPYVAWSDLRAVEAVMGADRVAS